MKPANESMANEGEAKMKKAMMVGLVLSLVFGVSAVGLAASGDLTSSISESQELVVTVGKWAELAVGADSLAIALTEPGKGATKSTSVIVKTNTGVQVTLTSPGTLIDGDLSWAENQPNSALDWYISFSDSDRSNKSYELVAGSTDTSNLYFHAKWNGEAAEWWQLKATNTGYKGIATVTVAAK